MIEGLKREPMRACVQFLGVTGDDEPNPHAEVVGVSAGTFKCGACEADHPGLVVEVAGDGRGMTLFLTGDNAKVFAASCSRVLAGGAS